MKIGAVPVEDIEKIRIKENSRILEIGADSERNFTTKYGDLNKMLFNGDYKYDLVTIELAGDRRPSVVADGRYLPFKDSSFDAVIVMSVLEHCYKNFDVILLESRRVLSEDGIVIGFVPFFLGYHENDYWRFTYEGVEKLVENFSKFKIIPVGGPISTSFQIVVDLIKPLMLRKVFARMLSPLSVCMDRLLWRIFKKGDKNASFVSRGYLFICEK